MVQYYIAITGRSVSSVEQIDPDKVEQPEQLEALNDQEDTNLVSEGDKEESQATDSTRRLTRQTSPIARLEPTFYGKLYMQDKKRVTLSSRANQIRS
jgi:hypothetical protein